MSSNKIVVLLTERWANQILTRCHMSISAAIYLHTEKIVMLN